MVRIGIGIASDRWMTEFFDHAECDHLLDVRFLDGRTDDDDPVVVDDITEVDGTIRSAG